MTLVLSRRGTTVPGGDELLSATAAQPPEAVKNRDWILDSGAYSAWRRRVPIDVDAYITFIGKHADVWKYIVCLDTIPGEFGSAPTPKEVELAADRSYANYSYMREQLADDIDPSRLIPVYHQGEEIRHLEQLIETGAQYIGISPTNGLPRKQRLRWAREAMNVVPKGIKTHGFGIATLQKEDCIFHSMDSSSWSLGAGYGMILAASTTGWKWVSLTSQFDLGACARIEDLVVRARERAPSLPQILTAELLIRSPYARAVWNVLVHRAAVNPCPVYSALLFPQLVTAIRYWAPRWLLSSFYLMTQGGQDKTLLKSLLGPRPSEQTAIQALQPKRRYHGTAKRRGKPNRPSLPGLA